VGLHEGALEGFSVGVLEGLMVGPHEGALEGVTVGLHEGSDGAIVTVVDGFTLGDVDGM